VEKSEEISTGRGEIDGVNANATHTGKLKSLITPTTTIRMAFVVCINQAQKHRSGLSCRLWREKKKISFSKKKVGGAVSVGLPSCLDRALAHRIRGFLAC
jgi:hypothetical protein